MGLFNKKEPMTSQKLSDITRGMHHAASSTMNMIATQYLYFLDQFFDKTDDNGLSAKMVRVDINDNHYMMVPLISMVAPKGLALENMKVKMSVKMGDAEIKKATHHFDDNEATRSSFSVFISPRSENKKSRRRSTDVVDLEMNFAAMDPPEGIMSVIDEYVKLIEPIKLKDGEEKPAGLDLKKFSELKEKKD